MFWQDSRRPLSGDVQARDSAGTRNSQDEAEEIRVLVPERARSHISHHLSAPRCYTKTLFPEMEWHDASEDFAGDLDKVEKELESYISVHGAVLNDAPLDLLSKAKILSRRSAGGSGTSTQACTEAEPVCLPRTRTLRAQIREGSGALSAFSRSTGRNRSRRAKLPKSRAA